MPPRIPARKAPKRPQRLFLKIRLMDGMKLKISQVCKAISTIKTPSTAATTTATAELLVILCPMWRLPSAILSHIGNGSFGSAIAAAVAVVNTLFGVFHYRNWCLILAVDMVRTDIHTNAALCTSHIINDWIPFLSHNVSLLFKFFSYIVALFFERAYHS